MYDIEDIKKNIALFADALKQSQITQVFNPITHLRIHTNILEERIQPRTLAH